MLCPFGISLILLRSFSVTSWWHQSFHWWFQRYHWSGLLVSVLGVLMIAGWLRLEVYSRVWSVPLNVGSFPWSAVIINKIILHFSTISDDWASNASNVSPYPLYCDGDHKPHRSLLSLRNSYQWSLSSYFTQVYLRHPYCLCTNEFVFLVRWMSLILPIAITSNPSSSRSLMLFRQMDFFKA